MDEKKLSIPPENDRLKASDLRQRIIDKEIEKAKEAAAKLRLEDDDKRRAHDEFMEKTFSDEDRLRFRRLAEIAADQGRFELELVKFPAEYLSDGGRRINNAESDWPVSLVGYAKSLYDAYDKLGGREAGYHLVPRVLNYPNGMIGEVGLYLSWK